MAGKNDPFEVKKLRGKPTDRHVRKMLEQGWELVDAHRSLVLAAGFITLRRPNPKYKG